MTRSRLTRTARLTTGLLVLSAVLAACSSPDPGSEDGGGPTGGAGDESTRAEPSSPAAIADLEPVFGSLVAAREDGSFGLDRWSLIDEGPPDASGPAIRVAYPAGSVSPSASRKHGVPEGGMQVYLPLVGEAADSAYLRYWVRFPDDFEFVKGGKLPGLYGGTEVSGGEESDGTDGFSTRLMWRADGDGEVYLYAADESGTSLGRGDWTWDRGAWLCVEQHVVLNDPEEKDGSVSVWIDGIPTFSEEGMRYRTVADLRIDGIFFSTFYGGADPSWAPSTDQHADFAGFAVSDQPIGCG